MEATPVPDPDHAGEGRSPRRPFTDDVVSMSAVTGPERRPVAARRAGVTGPRVPEAIGRLVCPRAASLAAVTAAGRMRRRGAAP